MPVLSHLHHLCNADRCQAYIHTLRWKDRPLQCPRCQSHHIGRWGTYQYRPGCKRYWCHNCMRTFNDLTETLFACEYESAKIPGDRKANATLSATLGKNTRLP